MRRRVRAWLESQLGAWAPSPEAPQVLVPPAKLHSQYLETEEEAEDEESGDDDPFADYPWGLPSEQLLYLDWNRTVGMAGGTSYELVAVPGLASLLVEIGFDGYVLLGGIRGEPKDADTLFLELLLRTNGRAFHTGVIGSAPCEFRASAPDHEWLVERMIDLFDDTAAWESLEEDCPWVSEPIEVELQQLATLTKKSLEKLNSAYDALRPPEPPRGRVMAMIYWQAGRWDWIRGELLKSKKAKAWLRRRKVERFLEGKPEGWRGPWEPDA
jgi:hypothetical protein